MSSPAALTCCGINDVAVIPGVVFTSSKLISHSVSLPFREGVGVGSSILGCIDLFDFDARNRKAAIGMYIAPDARGKGVGKQAVQLLEDYAFGFLHLRMIYAIISVHNTACSHIYEQMGYTPSSVLRDWTLEGDAVLWQKSR